MKYLTLSLLLVCLMSTGRNLSAPVRSTPATNVAGGHFTTIIFEDSVKNLYERIGLERYDLPLEPFRYAMIGYHSLSQKGKLNDKKLLTIIDFTKASTEKRFYTIDLNTLNVRFNTYVSHGKNTGENHAKAFSNIPHSNQSSLGFYVTAETYVGSKGYSLKLDGMDPGFNDRIRDRAVVMHSANYVSEDWIRKYGRLGRSQGCPALPNEISRTVIDTIKGGTMIFAYFRDEKFLTSSAHLDLENVLNNYNTAVAAP